MKNEEKKVAEILGNETAELTDNLLDTVSAGAWPQFPACPKCGTPNPESWSLGKIYLRCRNIKCKNIYNYDDL